MTLRVKVTATDSTGASGATSVPTAVVASAAPAMTVRAATARRPSRPLPPSRLVIDQYQVTPATVTPSTDSVTVRFHVSDTCGQAVQDALVFATTVPFNPFAIAPEQATDANGWAQLEMQRLSGFPLLVVSSCSSCSPARASQARSCSPASRRDGSSPLRSTCAAIRHADHGADEGEQSRPRRYGGVGQ